MEVFPNFDYEKDEFQKKVYLYDLTPLVLELAVVYYLSYWKTISLLCYNDSISKKSN